MKFSVSLSLNKNNSLKDIALQLRNTSSPFYAEIFKEVDRVLRKQISGRLSAHPENSLAMYVKSAFLADKNFFGRHVFRSKEGVSYVSVMWDTGYPMPFDNIGKMFGGSGKIRGDRGSMAKLAQAPPWIDETQRGIYNDDEDGQQGVRTSFYLVRWDQKLGERTNIPWDSYHHYTEDAFNIVEWGTRVFKKDKGDPRFVFGAGAGPYFVGIKLFKSNRWAKGEILWKDLDALAAGDEPTLGGKVSTRHNNDDNVSIGENHTSLGTEYNPRENRKKNRDVKSDATDGRSGSSSNIFLDYLDSLGIPAFAPGVHPLNVFTDRSGNVYREDLDLIGRAVERVGVQQLSKLISKKGGK